MLHVNKAWHARPRRHFNGWPNKYTNQPLTEMLTPWGENLDYERVLQEHPNPQKARRRYRVLNGVWSCTFINDRHDPEADLTAVVSRARMPLPDAFDCDIVVPFSPEAPLSGVGRQLQPYELLWYRRSFDCPALARDERLILHFQAVDCACACRVNGKLVGTHEGGYTPFSFDITDQLAEGANEIAVCVADPSEFGEGPRGKQRLDRGDIWYTAQSGIWQTVWAEIVPTVHIEDLMIDADAQGVVSVGVRACGFSDALGGLALSCEVFEGRAGDGAQPLAAASAVLDEATGAVAVQVPDVRLWTPDDPYLYRLRITLGDDVVESYCGCRSVAVRHDEHGQKRLYLNGEPLFIKGVLDQAYWSDGLMTAPSDEALVYDIESMRDAGFNCMRMHLKLETARWYYHCDRLGMLVIQDMVNGGISKIKAWYWGYKPMLSRRSWVSLKDDKPEDREKLGSSGSSYREEWVRTCRGIVLELVGHPCVVAWSLFNEGWGQFNSRYACELVRSIDPTRPIDAASGWYDQGCGDFSSVHNYFRDLEVWHDVKNMRAFLISEFGGLTHYVPGHSALPEAYGYERYEDRGEWRRALMALLARVASLEATGLAGYIYTQVSDVEDETNGILTYDRRVNKLRDL